MDSAPQIALAVFVLIGTAILVLASSGESQRERVRRRLTGISGATQSPGARRALTVLRRKQYSRIPALDAVLRRLDFVAGLETSLLRAGVPMRPGEFLLAQVVLAAAAAFAVSLVVGGQGPRTAAMGAAAVMAFLLPRVWLRLRRARRLAQFERSLPDALDLAAGSLRAGYGIAHGLDLIAHEMPGPCGQEFGQLHQDINMGSDFDIALGRLVERMESEDTRLLASAVGIQRRTGGNLVEVLALMSGMIRERLRVRGEVRVLTTAPRVSGYVVSCLPLVALAMTYVMSPFHIQVLLGEPIGNLMLAASGVLTLTGLIVNHKIAQVEL